MSSHIHRPHSGYVEPVQDLENMDKALVTFDTVVYITVLIAMGALLFLLVYFIITLSDLECDYLNAQQCCYRLNIWVLPKLLLHTVAGIILFLAGHYWLAAMSLPIVIIWGREYFKVPSGNIGVYDPTEIHKMGQLKRHMRDVFCCVLYYLIIFFIYLYCLLTHLVSNPAIPKPEPYADDSGL